MQEFFPFQLGSDHKSNIEADFAPWKDDLLKFIEENFY